MNYRHIYHAGNFADVFKHLIVLMLLGYLQQKEKGLFILDAFAGCGLYDLNSDQARRTQEYSSGIESIMNMVFANPDLKKYQSAVRLFWEGKQYPGSPLLTASELRPQDRLQANELHEDDVETLKTTLSGFDNTKITQIDAYQALRASLPPLEKRGLLIVDPPFERKDEFAVLAAQMQEWMKRFATGVYAIWYPIKADSDEHLLYNAARDLKINRACVLECLIRERDAAPGLNGCGMLILNTPFQIPERVQALANELSACWPGSRIESRYLTA